MRIILKKNKNIKKKKIQYLLLNFRIGTADT